MLNDIFGVHKQEGILNDIRNPMVGEYVEFDDEPEPNDTLNEEEHIEDAGYKRLVHQAEQELFSGLKFSKMSFLLHLFYLKSMHGWSSKSLIFCLNFCLLFFLKLIHFRCDEVNVSR